MDGVEKHEVIGERRRYKFAYQTPQTRALDEHFGLDGRHLSAQEVERLKKPTEWIGRTQQEIVMPYFAFVAGQAGHFVGLPLDEIEPATEGHIHRAHVEDSVQEGYLEQFEHEGVQVVAPTMKYVESPFT